MAVKKSSGIIGGASKGVLYGLPGIGKTTLINDLEQYGPVAFIDTENGTKGVAVKNRYVVEDHKDFKDAVEDVKKCGDINTLAIDSIDWLETLLGRKVCEEQVDSKGRRHDTLTGFGYGTGLCFLREEMDKTLFYLETVLRKGINVILIGHAEIVKFQEPERAEAYERYVLRLDKENGPKVIEWADYVLFMNWKTSIVEGEKFNKAVAVGGKERLLFTQHSAGWDGKNRYGLKDRIKADVIELAPIFRQKKEEKPLAKDPVFVIAGGPNGPIAENVLKFIELTKDLNDLHLKAFLVGRKQLSTLESPLSEVPEEYAKRAVSNISAFREAFCNNFPSGSTTGA